MKFTETQRDRINFHLDLDSTYNLLEVTLTVRTNDLSPQRQLTVVGDLENADTDSILVFAGNSLCTRDSILGRVEIAYRNLSPENVDNSLLVRKAGSVELRKDEYRARQKLYESMVTELERAMGYYRGSSDRANLTTI